MRLPVAVALAALALSSFSSPAVADDGLGPVVALAADRLATAELVAAAKWHTGDPVEAPGREAQVLADAEEYALALGVAPEAAAAVVGDQMEANKVVQRGLHAR